MELADFRTAIKVGAALMMNRHHLTNDKLAALLGISSSGVKRKLGLRDEADLGLDEVVKLTQATGDHQLLDLAESAVGRIAVELPPAEGSSPDLARQLLRREVAHGRTAEQLQRALVSATLPDIEQAILDEVRVLLGLRELLRKTVEVRR